MGITGIVIGCVIRVHSVLGPGFVERIYERALRIELRKRGLRTEVEKEVVVRYEGHVVRRHRIDLPVENELIVELRTVEALSRAHYAQVRSYLKAAGLNVALLVNFATPTADFRRIEFPPRVPTPIPPDSLPQTPPSPPP